MNTDIYLKQYALKALGFDPGPLDGVDGPKTKSANLLWLQSRDTPEPVGREINQNGIELIKHFEGLFLNAYKDPVGIVTIGYGHTGLKHLDGTVYLGRSITPKEAEDLLRHDIREFSSRVESFVKVPLTDDQFAALVSFDFNTGGLGKSTLLKKLNAGNYDEAADELLKWDKAGGKTLAGLTRRRKSERNLFKGIRPFIIK